MAKRRFSPEGVEVVEPGNSDVAQQLRKAFDVAVRFPVDLSQTIVPVVVVDKGGVQLSISPGEAHWHCGYAVWNPSSSGYGIVGIENRRDAGIVTVDEFRVSDPHTTMLMPLPGLVYTPYPFSDTIPTTFGDNIVGSVIAFPEDPREPVDGVHCVTGELIPDATNLSVAPQPSQPFPVTYLYRFNGPAVIARANIVIPPGYGWYIVSNSPGNQIALEARGRQLRAA